MIDETSTRNKIKNIYQNNFDVFAKHNGHLKYCFKTYFNGVYDDVFKTTQFLDVQNPSFRARMYCIVHDIYEIPKCVVCGKKIDIHDNRPSSQMQRTCSIACARRDPEYHRKCKETISKHTEGQKIQFAENRKRSIQKLVDENPNYWKDRYEKAKQTKKRLFGDENYMNFGSPSYKSRIKEKYGDENYNNRQKAVETYQNKSEEEKQRIKFNREQTIAKLKQSDPDYQNRIVRKSISTRKKLYGKDFTNRAKCRSTMLDRYGVENAYQVDSVKQKIKENNIERYGVEYYSSTKECRDKIKNTCNEKYGSACYLASETGKQKIKESNLKRYGVEHNWQRDDVKEKIARTNLDRYGSRSAMQNPEIVAKTRQRYELVMIERYGVRSYFSTDEYKQMCIKKYGTEHPMQNPEFRKNQQTRYLYENVKFDSGAELIFYIWLKDKGIDFLFQPNNISFAYEFENKVHAYCPDFKIGNQIIEIKGDHFFKEDGTMCNPYDHSQDALYEAKHQCMVHNDVKIIRSSELIEQKQHFIERFGSLSILKDFKKK